MKEEDILDTTSSRDESAAATDRTVHGRSTHGAEVVRYDRQGHWSLEWPDGRRRIRVTVDHAAQVVVFGQFAPGLPGGKRFDALVRRRRAEEARDARA